MKVYKIKLSVKVVATKRHRRSSCKKPAEGGWRPALELPTGEKKERKNGTGKSAPLSRIWLWVQPILTLFPVSLLGPSSLVSCVAAGLAFSSRDSSRRCWVGPVVVGIPVLVDGLASRVVALRSPVLRPISLLGCPCHLGAPHVAVRPASSLCSLPGRGRLGMFPTLPFGWAQLWGSPRSCWAPSFVLVMFARSGSEGALSLAGFARRGRV